MEPEWDMTEWLMKCPDCGRVMRWRRTVEEGEVVVLWDVVDREASDTYCARCNPVD